MMNILRTCVPTGNMQGAFCRLRSFYLGYRCSVMSLAWNKFYSAWSISSLSGVKLSSAFSSDSHENSSLSRYRLWYSQNMTPVPPGPSRRLVSVYRGTAAMEGCSSPSPASHACWTNLSPIGCLRCRGILWKALTATVDTCLECLLHHSIVTSNPMPGWVIARTYHGPVHFSWTNYSPTPSRWKLLLVSRTIIYHLPLPSSLAQAS